MSLKYFARYRFNASDVAEEDYGLRDLAVESGSLDTFDDPVYGSCLTLNGATSLLSTGSFTNIADDTDRCFSFWARISTQQTNTSPVLCYGELSSPNAFVLYARNSNGYPEFFDYALREAVSTDETVTDDTWTFFTFSCKAGEIKIFVDGVVRFTESITMTTGTTDPLRIGTDGQGEYFEGYLLDLRMWETYLDESVVEYMFSVGPNFEEDLSTNYAEDTARAAIITGNLLCRTTYGIQQTQDTNSTPLTQSFFCLDDNAELQEAARIEHTQESNYVASEILRVRHKDEIGGTNTLEKTIEITPETTTFSSKHDSETSSVVFSSQGVHLVAGGEKGCIFFGAGRDFRIRVGDGSFLVEAYSSATDDYQKKMEISS